MRYLKLKRGKKKFRHISEGLNLYNKKNDGTIVSDSEIGEMSSLKGKIVILDIIFIMKLGLLNENAQLPVNCNKTNIYQAERKRKTFERNWSN